ncbi:PA0069 family radical SAM protein [Lentiprolixibacter aurantiacus]|uniref:PA0069 family radical SAM protein n=1 Tax=Lentiprolixibacter aurantiacus TaxID=2993939 RepID=A0AAE3MJP4_9FLAO|nr:PA0069 family radical SAM protein [Lentiprolixibacter aurantiacus]MCX2718684.1 PA0069 family radical SAM protein [Lentiprolixibacter aurantiacus]
MKKSPLIKGRGAQSNHPNRFLAHIQEHRDDFLEYCRIQDEPVDNAKTLYLPIHPKTIVNEVKSPDLSMEFSMNPYQGCEHGCVYCYARNTHEYWGYSAGLDFEKRILIKQNAARLLEERLKKKSWKANTIVMSGNTDCYQPAEKKFRITRACLQVFLKYRHPVGIITKNDLILRDLDLLRELNRYNLVAVHISVTTLSERTRRMLEPRTSTAKKRLKLIKKLSEAGIPVNAMLAPIIPGINSHELLSLARTCAEHGAISFGYTVVRLNGAIGKLFTEWIRMAMPDRASKVLNQIASCHGGQLNDSRFGIRTRGEGKLAEQIKEMARLARSKYYKGKGLPSLDATLHGSYKNDQLRLF